MITSNDLSQETFTINMLTAITPLLNTFASIFRDDCSYMETRVHGPIKILENTQALDKYRYLIRTFGFDAPIISLYTNQSIREPAIWVIWLSYRQFVLCHMCPIPYRSSVSDYFWHKFGLSCCCIKQLETKKWHVVIIVSTIILWSQDIIFVTVSLIKQVD